MKDNRDTDRPQEPHAGDEDAPIVQPPSTMTVDHSRKPVLFTADGRALVRKAGYVK